MVSFKKPQRGSIKLYLIYISLIGAVIALLINFFMLPGLLGIIAETSPAQAEAIKGRFLNGMIVFFTLIFLFDFYFWRKDNELKKEAKETRKILEINLEDPAAQGKLKQIERKRKTYTAIIEPIFVIIIGLIIGFLALTILTPLYHFIGTP